MNCVRDCCGLVCCGVWGHTCLDLRVHGCLLGVILLVVVGVHPDVVECKLLLDPVLERLPLLQCQAVGFGDDWDNIDGLAELLEHDNVDWLQCVTGWVDEVETAVDSSVLDIAFSLCGELLAEVCGVLVLDVFDDWVPAAVVVHEVAVAGSVYDIEAETNTILLDDVGDWVDLGGLADRFGGREATLGVDKV